MHDLLMCVVHRLLAADEFSLTKLRIDLTRVPPESMWLYVIHMDDNRNIKG
jgi:hypothetical protein